MRLLTLICYVLFALVSCKQKTDESDIDKDSPEALLTFIPKNYMLKDTVRGDLNLDGIKDLILVLNKVGEEETSDIIDNPEKRLMLILLGQKNNTYQKSKQSENAIYCYDCGGMLGDPFQKIMVKDGEFAIEHFGGSSWRWARTSKFKYIKDSDDWYLIEDALVNSHSGDPDNIEVAIKTAKDFGEVKFEDFDIYKE
jgi:calcineurin-like phosphoesterase family protein